MTSLFCRHNRMTAKCPICSKEMEAELRAKAPPRPAGIRRAPAAPRAPPRRSTPRSGGLVTRKLARAADDGYRNTLVPGLRATADAERLAGALLIAAERLEPPGPYEAVATEPDREQASWLAFLLALVGPDAPELQDAVAAAAPRYEDGAPAELPGGARPRRSPPTASGSSAAARRSRASPARPTGRRSAASPACSSGSRCPGLGRAPRFELLAALGAAGLYELVPDQLQLGVEEDAATQAAKRILLSGDKMLLERRARDLAARPPTSRSPRSTARSRCGATRARRSSRSRSCPAAMRSALALR